MGAIKVLILTLAVIFVLVVPSSALDADNINKRNKKRNLRGSQSSASTSSSNLEARRALSNAILSAVRSPTGKIDEDALNKAVRFGFGRQQVRHMTRLALKQKQVDGNADRVEKDLKELSSPDHYSSKKEKEGDSSEGETFQYKKKYEGNWNMDTQQHILVSRAVLSAIRSPTHEIDTEAMENAIKGGLTKKELLQYVDAALPK